jgi:hypothetical protein
MVVERYYGISQIKIDLRDEIKILIKDYSFKNKKR